MFFLTPDGSSFPQPIRHLFLPIATVVGKRFVRVIGGVPEFGVAIPGRWQVPLVVPWTVSYLEYTSFFTIKHWTEHPPTRPSLPLHLPQGHVELFALLGRLSIAMTSSLTVFCCHQASFDVCVLALDPWPMCFLPTHTTRITHWSNCDGAAFPSMLQCYVFRAPHSGSHQPVYLFPFSCGFLPTFL